MGPGGSARRVGLARALSKLGYCSRSQATELIRAGRVKLNGTTRRDPETPVHVERDRIEVDRRMVGA
jgi:23S rRNA pseudouridine2605 synthase